jgi:zinc transport system ATP-binding protein
MSALLTLSNIDKHYGKQDVLNNISLTINRGEIITLIGPNGAGKSTLLKIILGLLKPTNGKIWKKRGLRVGYMPQKLHIEESLPLSLHDFLMLIPKVNANDIPQALDRCGIQRLQHRPLQRLSGGETQRALLARALLSKPDLLVLDEPVQGVDINGQIQLYNLINNLRDELDCSVLMVSHDLHLVMAKTDSVICLTQHICCSGHPDIVSAEPSYQALFGSNSTLAQYTHHHDHHHHDDGTLCSNPEKHIPDGSV